MSCVFDESCKVLMAVSASFLSKSTIGIRMNDEGIALAVLEKNYQDISKPD